jgi:hypothetical protein
MCERLGLCEQAEPSREAHHERHQGEGSRRLHPQDAPMLLQQRI